jgi:hypothetical protein
MEIRLGPAVDVDPEELVALDGSGQARFEADLTIAPVRVVEPRPRARAAVRLGRQRIEASSTATMIARNARPYWSASIDRSLGLASSFAGRRSGRVDIGCSSIDRVDSSQLELRLIRASGAPHPARARARQLAHRSGIAALDSGAVVHHGG